jgi:DNA-binding beta-propeller fold protein YncE
MDKPPPESPKIGEFSYLIPPELQFGCTSLFSEHEDAFRAILEHDDVGQRLVAARALWKGHSRRNAARVIKFVAGTPPGGGDFRDLQKEVEAALRPEAILKELKDGDYVWGTWLAFLRPHKELVPVLLDGLKDKKDARHETVLALGNSGDPRALEPLLGLLKSNDYWVSGEAAHALGYLGDPKAEPALIEALGASDGREARVCGALAILGTKKALPPLLKVAETQGYTGAIDVRGAAMRAVVSIERRVTKIDPANDPLANNLEPAAILRGHGQFVWGLAFNSDGTLLSSASDDKTIRLWDPLGGKAVSVFNGHARQMQYVGFVGGDKRLATAGWGDDGSIRVLDSKTGDLSLTIPADEGGVGSMVVSDDGKVIASSGSGNDAGVRLWDATNGKLVFEFPKTDRALAFSPDGRLLVTTSGDEDSVDVQVWDIATRKISMRLAGHVESASCAAFSPDGKKLATAGDWTVKVWDLRTAKAIVTSRGDSRYSGLAYSPGGNWLAASEEERVRILDAGTGKPIRSLRARGPVAISPNGKMLATGSYDWSALLLWNLDQTQKK